MSSGLWNTEDQRIHLSDEGGAVWMVQSLLSSGHVFNDVMMTLKEAEPEVGCHGKVKGRCSTRPVNMLRLNCDMK